MVAKEIKSRKKKIKFHFVEQTQGISGYKRDTPEDHH